MCLFSFQLDLTRHCLWSPLSLCVIMGARHSYFIFFPFEKRYLADFFLYLQNFCSKLALIYRATSLSVAARVGAEVCKNTVTFILTQIRFFFLQIKCFSPFSYLRLIVQNQYGAYRKRKINQHHSVDVKIHIHSDQPDH